MRPISFDNISKRLHGFESARLHENDWRNVTRYVSRLELVLEAMAYGDERDLILKLNIEIDPTLPYETIVNRLAAWALEGEE